MARVCRSIALVLVVTALAVALAAGPAVVTASAAPVRPGVSVVTENASSVSTTGAVLNGEVTTDGNSAGCQFYYGTNEPPTSRTGSVTVPANETDYGVSIAVNGLTAGDTYYFYLLCDGVAGSTLSFVASTAPSSVVTEEASSVTSTGAVLNGEVTTGSSSVGCLFYFGTTDPPTGTTSSVTVPANETDYAVPIDVSGLTAGDTYYFYLYCDGLAGSVLSFVASTTTSVVTEAASSVTTTGAVLNGAVTTGSSSVGCLFYFGTTDPPTGTTSSVTVPANETDYAVPIDVSGLTAGDTYYFYLYCDGLSGSVLSFVASTTSVVVTEAASSVTTTGAVLNGAVTTGSSSVGCQFYYGTTDPPTNTTGSVTVAANETDFAISINVSSLTVGDTYYFYLYCDGLAGSVLSFVASTTTSPITQIYGSDPVGTAIAIAQAEFPGADSAGAVVLARSDFFSDALAGGPLAAHVNGPLLLTPGASISDEIDPRVMSEIEYVLPAGSVVYILGGDLALSPNIDSALISLGYTVVREAGQDEYATAVDIAQAIGNPNTIFLATGISFYDALSADPAAIKLGGAILLTDGATEAPETASYLAQFPGDIVYAIGGPDQALGADPSAIGIWGASLLDTSAAVASYFFPDASTYGAATDLDFSDALAGGVYMATDGRMGPLLLVDPGSPTLWPSVAAYLGGLASGTPGVVFGGPEAVPSNVVELLETAVG